MKKLVINIIILLLLASVVYADYEKVIVNNLNCKGTVRLRMYGNTTCYLKECSFDGQIWNCNCKVNTTVTMAAVNRDTCKATIEYYQQGGAKIVFPVSISWSEEIPIVEERAPLSPIVSIILFASGALAFILIILVVVHFVTKYIKKELEEDEKRNQ